MVSEISPRKTVTFTITKTPKLDRERKTIARLMRMQPHIQKGLKMLARRRRQHDNVVTARSGREWISRARVTNLTPVRPGETFTLTITPQIIPDLKSVEAYLKTGKG